MSIKKVVESMILDKIEWRKRIYKANLDQFVKDPKFFFLIFFY